MFSLIKTIHKIFENHRKTISKGLVLPQFVRFYNYAADGCQTI